MSRRSRSPTSCRSASSTTPQSPIDGPGGPGGVIEVITRDAIGEQLVIAPDDRRLAAELRRHRHGTRRAREAPRAAHLGVGPRRCARPRAADERLARRATPRRDRLGARSSTAKGDRASSSMASSTIGTTSRRRSRDTSTILMIDRETTARASTKIDAQRDKLQLQAQGWVATPRRGARATSATRRSRPRQQTEDLKAMRIGGMALATHPIGRMRGGPRRRSVEHDNATVSDIEWQTSRVATSRCSSSPAICSTRRRRCALDAAAGAAMPIGVGADPWPEAKLVAKWRPSFGPLELRRPADARAACRACASASISTNGNPDARSRDGEHRRGARDVRRAEIASKIEVAPFYKRTNGTVRASIDPTDMGKLINLGKLRIYGVDTAARVNVIKFLTVGAAYNYIKAHSDDSGDDPLDRLPHHRADAWVQGSYAWLTLLGASSVLRRVDRQDAPRRWLYRRRGDRDRACSRRSISPYCASRTSATSSPRRARAITRRGA